MNWASPLLINSRTIFPPNNPSPLDPFLDRSAIAAINISLSPESRAIPLVLVLSRFLI